MCKHRSSRTRKPCNILAAFLLTVLVLALAPSAFADDRPITNGPDLSDFPAAVLPSTGISENGRTVLSALGKLDPVLARKIEKKLKSTPDLRDRIAYMHKQFYKLEKVIDYAELNQKSGLASKNKNVMNIKIRNMLSFITITVINQYEDFLRDLDATNKSQYSSAYRRKYSTFTKRYKAHRSERRKRFGLHEEEGKSEPRKKAEEKPKKPGTKKTKKVCSGGSLTEGMNCVEVLIDQDG